MKNQHSLYVLTLNPKANPSGSIWLLKNPTAHPFLTNYLMNESLISDETTSVSFDEGIEEIEKHIAQGSSKIHIEGLREASRALFCVRLVQSISKPVGRIFAIKSTCAILRSLKITGRAGIISNRFSTTLTSPNKIPTITVWTIKFNAFIIRHNMPRTAATNCKFNT